MKNLFIEGTSLEVIFEQEKLELVKKVILGEADEKSVVKLKEVVHKVLNTMRYRNGLGGWFYYNADELVAVDLISGMAGKDKTKGRLGNVGKRLEWKRAGKNKDFMQEVMSLVPDISIKFDSALAERIQKAVQKELDELFEEEGRDEETRKQYVGNYLKDYIKYMKLEEINMKREENKGMENTVVDEVFVEETVGELEKAFSESKIKVVKTVDAGELEKKKKSKKAKADGEYDISIPDVINMQTPLKVFECDVNMKEYCKNILGNTEILVWSMNDATTQQITICMKYVVDGNQDAPIRKVSRADAMNSKGYLKFLMGYPGMDKSIMRYVGEVVKQAMPVLDKAEKGRKATLSPIETYKAVVDEIRHRALKIVDNNKNSDNEPLDVIFKEIQKENVNGEVVNYVCTKGSKALKAVLSSVGAECRSLDFLTEMKLITEYKNSSREFLEVSPYRQFDYTETGGTHWMHLRVYDDIWEDTEEEVA